MTVVGPPEARPADGLAVDFVVEADRAQLREIVQRVRDGDFGPTSATSRPSTMLSQPSTRLSDATGKRSSTFVHEDLVRAPSTIPRGWPYERRGFVQARAVLDARIDPSESVARGCRAHGSAVWPA